jgi:hypothetical protein
MGDEISENEVVMSFRINTLFLCILFVLGASWALASASSAQSGVDLRGQRPLDNYYRNVGGSCIYDRLGNLVHTPKGE